MMDLMLSLIYETFTTRFLFSPLFLCVRCGFLVLVLFSSFPSFLIYNLLFLKTSILFLYIEWCFCIGFRLYNIIIVNIKKGANTLLCKQHNVELKSIFNSSGIFDICVLNQGSQKMYYWKTDKK